MKSKLDSSNITYISGEDFSPATIAIIGGGAVGTSTFCQLVNELILVGINGHIKIVVFEKAEAVGPGLAYQPDQAPYLLNRSVESMSVFPDKADHFLE